MATIYKNLKWVFDAPRFSRAVLEACNEYGGPLVAECLGVDISTLTYWKSHLPEKATPYPNMTNFIKFCNEMGFDPRSFWMLEE